MSRRIGPLTLGQAMAITAGGCALLMVLVLATLGEGILGGGSMLFGAAGGCAGQGRPATAPATGVSAAGKDSIPANYLRLYQHVGRQYGVPWALLAGIGEVETNHGRSTLPGVRSGANAFGAAGPMQIGIGGASGNTWGGAPIHPASEHVPGVATDEDGRPTVSVYDPADAIAGAAKYLLAHGVLSDVSAAIFAYNHLFSYVQSVLSWAGVYSRGGFTISSAVTSIPVLTDLCPAADVSEAVPSQTVATAIAYARAQLGKMYLWGGTGPDMFDCSGLVMMAYRAAGIDIPRTSQAQYAWGPRVPESQVRPGDLAFFVGSDGTVAHPGHVGLVIGNGLMIEAYATGFPIRIAPYGDRDPVGFTRPWAHAGVRVQGAA